MASDHPYSLPVTEDHLKHVIEEAKDWCLTHGKLPDLWLSSCESSCHKTMFGKDTI